MLQSILDEFRSLREWITQSHENSANTITKRVEQRLLSLVTATYIIVKDTSRKVGILMADAATFQGDLDALKAKVEAVPARVVAAIQAAGPLSQAQLDAADAEIQAIGAEADAIAPAPVVAPAPTPAA